MKKIDFFIAENTLDGGITFSKRSGHAKTISNGEHELTIAFHRGTAGNWFVTETSSGIVIAGGQKTKSAALDAAKLNFGRMSHALLNDSLTMKCMNELRHHISKMEMDGAA
jgi:hypothetical protein